MMLGHCFAFHRDDGFAEPAKRIIPLENEPVFFGREGSGQQQYAYGTTYAEAGMAMADLGGGVLFGAPGAWNWTGTFVA